MVRWVDGLAPSPEWQRGHAGPSGHIAASNHILAASSSGNILSSSSRVIPFLYDLPGPPEPVLSSA